MRHHLRDALVLGARIGFEAFEQLDLGRGRQGGERIERRIERATCRFRELRRRVGALRAAAGGDRAHRFGGVTERQRADIVGIGESRFLAGDRPHADALVDVEAARFDDAFFEAPGLGAAVLEIEIGVIDFVRHDRAEHLAEVVHVEPVRRQQGLARLRQQGRKL